VRKYGDVKDSKLGFEATCCVSQFLPLNGGIDDVNLYSSGSLPPHLFPLSHLCSVFLKLHLGPHDSCRFRNNNGRNNSISPTGVKTFPWHMTSVR
jgi:hypothetical protein